MAKKIALLSLLLWVLTISFLAYKFYAGNAVTVDQRTEVSLSDGDRDLILGEMRLLLKGVKGIVAGLSQDDFKLVETSARSVGMAMAQDVNPALMMKLPQGFKMMGMGVHKDFDTLADKVHQMNAKEILTEVNTIMAKCVSCHETYQLKVTK